MPGYKSLQQGTRWLRSRFGQGALILGYHRISEEADDAYSLCVRPQNFSEQLAILRRYANPITLDALSKGLKTDKLPSRAVVVTFDDGYADNLYQAKPLLEQYDTPATIFVATGYLGRRFWWDDLLRMLLSDNKLPELLSISLAGGTFVWATGDNSKEKKSDLLREVYRCLLGLEDEERRLALIQLSQQIGVDADEVDTVKRALTPEELTVLAKDGLVTIGSHTVNHTTLTSLSKESQRREIEQCKLELETLLEKPVSAFSYPNGASDEVTQYLVRLANYACACNSYNDVTRLGADPFNLPRFWVPDQNGEDFSRWLRRWLTN